MPNPTLVPRDWEPDPARLRLCPRCGGRVLLLRSGEVTEHEGGPHECSKAALDAMRAQRVEEQRQGSELRRQRDLFTPRSHRPPDPLDLIKDAQEEARRAESEQDWPEPEGDDR